MSLFPIIVERTRDKHHWKSEFRDRVLRIPGMVGLSINDHAIIFYGNNPLQQKAAILQILIPVRFEEGDLGSSILTVDEIRPRLHGWFKFLDDDDGRLHLKKELVETIWSNLGCVAFERMNRLILAEE